MNTKTYQISILLTIIGICFSYNSCGMGQMPLQRNFAAAYQNSGRFLTSSEWTQINIVVDYSTIDHQQWAFPPEYVNAIKEVANKTISLLKNLFLVKPATKTFAVSSCFEAMINDSIKSGVPGDLFLFPYINSGISNDTIVRAGPCLQDSITGRVIAGAIEFGSVLNTKNKNALNYYVSATLHEVFHLLGFNKDLFEYFINPNTGAKLGLGNVIRNATINGVDTKILVTPKVLQTARKYFNCSSLQGMELEGQPGSRLQYEHWDVRIMYGDLMATSPSDEMFLSEITLAFMEDTGWYKMNYYTGGIFRFGKMRGCDFLNKKCIQNGTAIFQNEYNAEFAAPMCYAGRFERGKSSMSTGLTIPLQYQYFADDSTKGGVYKFADYCPVAYANTDKDYFYPSSCITGKRSDYPSSMGEVIGLTSTCFMSSLTPMNDNLVIPYKGLFAAMCYPVICNPNEKTIIVSIGSKTVVCPTQGGTVAVDGFDGNLICPDYNLLCSGIVWCTDVVDCVEKRAISRDLDYTYTPDNTVPIGSNYLLVNNTIPASSSVFRMSYFLEILLFGCIIML